MKRILPKVFFLLGAGILLSSQNVEAHSPHWNRNHDRRVNTWRNKHYDDHHDRRLGRWEKRQPRHARVDTFKEWICDRNRDGYINPRESRCL